MFERFLTVDLEGAVRPSFFRKLAFGTWKTSYSPVALGTADFKADKALQFLDEVKQKTLLSVTITHFIVAAYASALKNHPGANAIIRWNRIYRRRDIAGFVQVSVPHSEFEKMDLSGTCVRDLQNKSITDIAREINERASHIRDNSDVEFGKARKSLQMIPDMLIFCVMQFIAFVCFTLNLRIPGLGLGRDPMGSFMVTNIGSLGLDVGYAPLVPYSRVPAILSVGRIRDAVVVEDGKICVQKRIALHGTFDHRIFDGQHLAAIVRHLEAVFSNPSGHISV